MTVDLCSDLMLPFPDLCRLKIKSSEQNEAATEETKFIVVDDLWFLREV
jgi:hypothetical protein